jgi:hypothetical protein
MGENQDQKLSDFSELSKEKESEKELKKEDLDDVSGGVITVATCGNCGKTLDQCKCPGFGLS